MKGDIHLKINKKIGLLLVAVFGAMATAQYVSLIDAKSSGGINVIQAEESAPIGTIAMWSTNTPPEGWIELNGQSTSGYPELAALIGSNVPDFRGQFVRAWDNNKGVDATSGRTLLSFQGDTTLNVSGSAGISGGGSMGAVWSGSGPFGVSGSAHGHLQGANTSYNAYRTLTFNLSKALGSSKISTEIRPKNISVMYIIRAE